MSLLVTTSFSLLEIDEERGIVRRVHSGEGLYYGITEADGDLYVAARRRMVSSDSPIWGERGEILVFGRDLVLKDRLCAPFPLRDIHQILWHQDRLWVTCSYDNSVAIWNGVSWDRWYPLGGEGDNARDVWHFNSLHGDGDSLWLLAHNWGPSELLEFCVRTGALLRRVQLGNQAHDIWADDGHLHTCSSGEGKIVSAGGLAIETGGFPRGYTRVSGRRYVGISELAERKDRDLTAGRIQVYDEAWRRLSTIELPRDGLVLDIRPI